MIRIVAALLALLLLAAPAADAKPKAPKPKLGFYAGAAKTLVNPVNPQTGRPENICLGGYGDCADGAGRTMTGVKDDLYARAVAFADRRGGSFIAVNHTSIGLFASYKTLAGVGSYYARQAIAAKTGVPAGHIVIQADHSHAGPDTIGIWGGIPTWYLTQLQDGIVDAAVRAWNGRQRATLFAGTADGPGVTSSYAKAPNDSVDTTFNLLWAEDSDGQRILSWANYSPHATVLGSSNKGASGDWPEWAATIAESRWGGTGLGSIGTLGREDFGTADKGAKGEAQARERLERMYAAATASAEEVPSDGGVKAKTVFIREPLTQPILLANLFPEGTLTAPGLGYDISMDRDANQPWLTGTLIGTFAGAARIGDVFIGAAPGESFPEIGQYLREEGGVEGPRMWMHLGASNDFLGYMLRPADRYIHVAKQGALYLAGCPQNAVLQFVPDQDTACPDHWTLMVSPTIGQHVACTIQDAAGELGFATPVRAQECETLTRQDGQGAPSENPGRKRTPAKSARRTTT